VVFSGYSGFRHNVTEIFLKVALNTIALTLTQIQVMYLFFLGFAIYFGYGIRNSSEGHHQRHEPLLADTSDSDEDN
jgi:hypothetical protein